nr:cysteine synthase A [Clostridiales bacterium]
MNVYQSVAELVGSTPLMELVNTERAQGLEATLLAKLEM